MKKTLIILLAITLGLSSCEKWLDINTSPNTSTDGSPDNLFGYAAIAWSGNRSGGDSYLPIGFSAQNLATGGNYGWGYGEDRYDISPFSLGNTWKVYYSTSGNNLRLAMRQAEEQGAINKVAQSQILAALLAYEATMFWGDMPFTEAWNDEITDPVFDTQEYILNQAIVMLEEAIEMIDLNDPVRIIETDLFYEGDLEKWIRLANSAKFRILMVMVDKDPSKTSEIAAMLNEGDMISSNDDNFAFPWLDEPNKENPKYKLFDRYAGGSNVWIFANKNVFDFMEPVNDPRIHRYFKLGLDDPTEYSAVATASEADGTTSLISDYLYRATAPDLIFSYQEQLFFEAEAYARGLGVSQDLSKANDLYKEAVKEAALYYEVDGSAAINFANSLPALTGLSQDEAVRQIHIQQWVDLMDRSLEAWVQWRRSGPEGQEVPNLTLPNGAPAGGLIRRWDYPPDEELSLNTNVPANPPLLYENLWFDL